MRQHGALGSATIVVVSRILTSCVAMALGILSASYFGTSAAKDCYLVAEGIPTFTTTILIGGLYTSLVLALAEIGRRGGVTAQKRFVATTLLRMMAALVPAVIVVAIAARPLVHVIAPGFPDTQVELTAWLLRVSLLGSLGGFVLVVTRSLFQTRGRFVESGTANILTALVSLVALVALASHLGIFALAWCAVLGVWASAIFLGVLAYLLLKDPPGYVAPPSTSSDQSGDHRFLWSAFLPMSLGTTFGQVNILIDNAFASYLPAGNITVLGFANVIVTNVVALTAWPIVEVTFPRMVAASNRSDALLIDELRASQRYMFLLMAPIAAGVLSFGHPMARLLFERKAFGPESTLAVTLTLACYGVDILLMGSVLLLSRCLFARRRMKLVAAMAIGVILLNTALDAILVSFFGVFGIALATSCVTLACYLFLRTLVIRDIGPITRPGDGAYAARVIASAFLVAVAASTWAALFERYADVGTELFRIVEVIGGIGLGASVYLAALRAAGIADGSDLVRRFWGLATGAPTGKP